MGIEKLKTGIMTIEVKILNPERLLNILWERDIKLLRVKRIDIATIIVEINYNNYQEFRELIRELNGKITIKGYNGLWFILNRMKKALSLCIGAIAFILIIFYLSTYVWAVEITTNKNMSPFEVRQVLQQIGIHPGISKKAVDVDFIERSIEDKHNGILWSRARVEGSTLKIVIEEKVNPPEVKKVSEGNLVSKMEGQVQRVYTYSGRPKVSNGEFVKPGQVVIEGVSGKEGEEFVVPPNGVVMANTFYEKKMQVKLSGTVNEQSGKTDKDYYFKVFGKKFYVKKAIKNFKEYDKIEESGKIVNKVTYYERVDKEVTLSKEEAINNSVKELEASLLNNLTREAKIVNKIVTSQEGDQGNLIVDVVFIVEQNIVDNKPVE